MTANATAARLLEELSRFTEEHWVGEPADVADAAEVAETADRGS